MAGKKQKISKKKLDNEVVPEQMQLEVRNESARQGSPSRPASERAQDSVPRSETVQGSVMTTETVKRKSGGPRSVCAMYKVVVKKAQGRKIKVTYNRRGVPNGQTRSTLQSYIGMLARTMVPIDIPTWPDVDVELKHKLWTDIQVYYIFLQRYIIWCGSYLI